MKFHRVLIVGAIGAACFYAQTEQQTAARRDTLPSRQPSAAERVGPATLRGILIDGGCQDRDNLNLRAPAETLQAASPAQPANAASKNPPVSGAVSAKGIAVDAATIAAERGEVMESHVPGMFERQSDPTCAVTGSTTSFALLTDSGRLLDLDEGGNTLALEAVESSAPGRAMLNGQGPGVKLRVTVKGTVRNDRELVTLDVRGAS